MNERIKKLRRALGLTQQEFADRIGSKRTTIAKYETDTNIPSSAVVSLICREFNVSETWLRTGEGEMFDQREENIIDRLCAELHASELDAEIIRAYFRIDPRIREPFMRGLIREVQSKSHAAAVDAKTATTTPAPPTGTDIPAPAAAPDLAAKVAELERQNQELAAKVAAMEEEDALYGLMGISEASPGKSVLNLNPNAKK